MVEVDVVVQIFPRRLFNEEERQEGNLFLF